jgi:hypothetical protein
MSFSPNLASDLTISKTNGIISGIDDIKNGKLSYSRIGILVGSALEDYYLQEISNENRNFYPVKTEQDIYNCLLNNIIDASIINVGIGEYITSNIYCNLTLVGTDFDENSFEIVFQKNWLYQQEFDVNILSLRESGVLDDLRNQWFQTNFCSQSSDSSSTAMTIESMAGLFLTFGIISILALLLILWQRRFIIRDSLVTFRHLLTQRDLSTGKNPVEVSSMTYPTVYL